MQQGRQTKLLVQLPDIPPDSVESIDFYFKQSAIQDLPVLKKANYPKDVTYSNDREGYLMLFTVQDTYRFIGGHKFCGEARIHLKDTDDMPDSPHFELMMEKTIIPEGE